MPLGQVAVLLDGTRRLYVPAEFEVGFRHEGGDDKAPPEVWIEFGAGTGAPPAVQAIRAQTSPLAPITPDRFRRIPLATYIGLAVAAAADTREEIETPSLGKIYAGSPAFLASGAAGDRETWRERKLFFDELARRPVGRPKLEEAIDLSEVREVAAAGAPASTKAVQTHFHVSRSTARRYIRRAEDKRAR
jgi:hypothetical protein